MKMPNTMYMGEYLMNRQKILLTGSAGFIGSNFIRTAIYEKHPYEFCSVDKIANSSMLNNIYQHKIHDFYIADICDQHIMDKIFEYIKPDIIIHMAAESAVDKSIHNPNIFVNSNILGTQVLINLAIKYEVKQFLYQSCYDEQTRAVTKNGFKKWNELKNGDKVLSINPISKEIEEKEIIKIISQDYCGDMISFKNKRIDLLTTPNHRFIVSKSCVNNSRPLEWTTAEDLENNIKNNSYYLPRGKANVSSPNTIVLPEIGTVDAEALFYVCGVFIGDGFTAKQTKLSANKSGFSKQEYLNKCRDKFGRFSQIPIRGNCDTTISNSYRIFFDVPENDKARLQLEASLIKLNIKYTAQKNKSGEHIYFSSEQWLKFFETFGKYAKNKHIPEWMFSCGTNLLENLWKGIHDSDGHGLNIVSNNIKRTISITTVSEQLTAQLCYIGSIIGYNTSVRSRHSVSYIDNRKIEGNANIIQFTNSILPKISKSIRQKYDGKIWCLTVKDNKNFLVERNGKIAFSGNTDEVYGSLESSDAPSWTEDAPLNPKNPYSASKASGELLIRAAGNTHKLPFIIVRSCNNYGPRQTSDKLIPRVIKSLLEEQQIPVYGKGLQVREWLHVHDNCAAIFKILTHGTIGETYNISSRQEHTNVDVVKEICNLMDKDHKYISFINDPRPGHDFRYSVNSQKLRNLGWAPIYKFKDGLQKTVESFMMNPFLLK